MNHYDLAVVNRQLAEMLDAGVPLEGGLRKAAASLRSGSGRREFEQLEEDLKRGTPLSDAVERRRLPQFYKTMLGVGASSDMLATVLRNLADYYHEKAIIRTRLAGLMVYPAIVLVCLLGFMWFNSWFLFPKMKELILDIAESSSIPVFPTVAPPVVISLLLVALICIQVIPSLRNRLSWHIPPFSYRNVANLAGMFHVCLDAGMNLRDTLNLLAPAECAPTSHKLQRMHDALAEGNTALEAAKPSGLFPPLCLWILECSGENLKEGFKSVASYYGNRARSTADVMLYAVLPGSLMVLGGLIMWQLQSAMGPLIHLLKQLGA